MSLALAMPVASMSASRQRRLASVARIAASVGLHAVLLALLVLRAQTPIEPPPQRSIAVELVRQAPASPTPATPVLTAPVAKAAVQQAKTVPAAPSSPAQATAPIGADGMVHATHLMAAGVLAEPGSQSVRETLPLLASDERMVQLCDIEALEQLRVWKEGLNPDVIVDYAMADAQVSGQTILADGAAFRSKRQWYAVQFKCDVAADYQSVTDFQFKVGALIPESQWESHDLNAEDLDD